MNAWPPPQPKEPARRVGPDRWLWLYVLAAIAITVALVRTIGWGALGW